MKSIHNRLFADLLPTFFAAAGCDPGDEAQAIELSEEELIADDEQAEQQDIDRVEELAVEAPEPLAGYWDCPAQGNFCFWSQPNYGGQPIVFPAGDFAVNFDPPVRSVMKRNGTYRVKLYGQPHFKGNCKVFGAEGDYAASPNLFEIRSARRMEPGEAFCP